MEASFIPALFVSLALHTWLHSVQQEQKSMMMQELFFNFFIYDLNAADGFVDEANPAVKHQI